MDAVVVTGASSGIGRATALRLDRAGFKVFATVREQADAESLCSQGSPRLSTPPLDVTRARSIARARKLIAEELGGAPLSALVNNAGIPVPGPLEELPIADFRRQLEVNVVGQLAVTQAFLPQIREVEGRIVFVSSLGGRVAFPLAGAYHASKFALEAVGETLRQELRPGNVEVVLVEPASASSEIWRKAIERIRRRQANGSRHYEQQLDKFTERLAQQDERGMDAEKVAEAIEEALTARSPSSRYPVGVAAQLLTRVRGLVPDRLFDALTWRTLRR